MEPLLPEQLPPPARRADAERNRAKILTAARAAFTDADAPVSMAEVSRRASVGMATLYRNFPGRRELLEALHADDLDTICTAAETLGGDTPGAVLMAWLREFATLSTAKRHLVLELLVQLDSNGSPLNEGRARVIAAGQPLLAAAQRGGEVRQDLTVDQVLDMVVAIAKIPGDDRYREPILRSALDGLRPPTGTSPRGQRGA